MSQKTNQKINYLIVPIVLVVATIVAIILGVCGYDWVYYLIGVFTGLLNHGLMLKMSRRIIRMAELYPDSAQAYAKKQAWLGVVIRLVVFMGIFLAIFFKEVYGKPEKMWVLVIAFGGYVTIKVVLVIVYLIFRKKVSD